jgi:hypothetical protein
MKAEQLKLLLQLYSDMIKNAQPDTASKILRLAERLGTFGAQTIKKSAGPNILNKAINRLNKEEFTEDDVSDALSRLGNLLSVIAAKNADDVQYIALVIKNKFWNSSDAFITAMSIPSNLSQDASPVRLDIVRIYSDELVRCRNDNNAFDHLVGRIKSDRNVRKQEMEEIATRFVGHRMKPATKAKLLEKIVDLQVKDASQEARGGHNLSS